MKTRIILFLVVALFISSPTFAQVAPQFVETWGSYGTGDGQFYSPQGVTVDTDGNVYIVDTRNYRIQKFDSSGNLITKWGQKGFGDGEFYRLHDIAIDSDGYVYVLEGGEKSREYGRVQKFTGSGSFILKWGSFGTGSGQFWDPCGIAIAHNGDILISDTGNHRIQAYSNTGQYITSFGTYGTANGQFRYPQGITTDSNGNIYVADGRNVRVQKFDSGGSFLTQWTAYACNPGEPPAPSDLAVDQAGNVYVASSFRWDIMVKCRITDIRFIKQFDVQGNFLAEWGPYGGIDEYFRYPKGIAADAEGNIYIADTSNHRIQVYRQAGPVTTPTPVGQHVIVPLEDPVSGNSYIKLNFDSVTTEGESGMTTVGTFPKPPYRYYPGYGPSFYTISTDAAYIGFVDMCVYYDSKWFKDDSMLKLFYYDGSNWTECTTSLDPVSNVICGRMPAFGVFGLFSPRPPFGTVTGHITADCPALDTPLAGVLVDAFLQKYADIMASAVTDSTGHYTFEQLPRGDYYITMIPPLGYETAIDRVPTRVVGDDTLVVDFSLSCVTVESQPRSVGFWKHQFGVAIGGKGHAHIEADSLCACLDLIADHFNSNLMNPVIVYQPPSWDDCLEKLLIAKDILNLWGSQEMIIRARQQLMALLMNVAANNISLTQVISDDGATVTQAITYCDNLIDNIAGDHERAKTIADLINNDKSVPAGMIPLNTVQIAYSPPAERTDIPAKPYLDQNYPNPFNPTTRIAFGIPENAHVQISIYNVLGQRVATLLNQPRLAGNHTVEWHGRDDSGTPVGSGIYFYKVVAGDFVSVRKMVLLK